MKEGFELNATAFGLSLNFLLKKFFVHPEDTHTTAVYIYTSIPIYISIIYNVHAMYVIYINIYITRRVHLYE